MSGDAPWKRDAQRMAAAMDRRVPNLDGPWDDEPDKADWRASGYACSIIRHYQFGTLNGYVGVPKGDPLWGLSYNFHQSLDVHGGVTFGGWRRGHSKKLWWYGFDTAHGGDYMPGLSWMLADVEHIAKRLGVQDTYRDIVYVKAECERLAAQIKVQSDALRVKTGEAEQ